MAINGYNLDGEKQNAIQMSICKCIMHSFIGEHS
jgi:hypothetical protein